MLTPISLLLQSSSCLSDREEDDLYDYAFDHRPHGGLASPSHAHKNSSLLYLQNGGGGGGGARPGNGYLIQHPALAHNFSNGSYTLKSPTASEKAKKASQG